MIKHTVLAWLMVTNGHTVLGNAITDNRRGLESEHLSVDCLSTASQFDCTGNTHGRALCIGCVSMLAASAIALIQKST